MYETATFAAGCFWGIEEAFRQTMGVISSTSGYTDGQTADPTYEQVCTDTTGHAEAVQVVFDPGKVSYPDLLNLFWKIHDPTQVNRQGPDVGTQYRSAIFYHSPAQEEAIKASLQALQQSGKYSKPIATAIKPASVFYPAEEYHQKYVVKHGRHCNL